MKEDAYLLYRDYKNMKIMSKYLWHNRDKLEKLTEQAIHDDLVLNLRKFLDKGNNVYLTFSPHLTLPNDKYSIIVV